MLNKQSLLFTLFLLVTYINSKSFPHIRSSKEIGGSLLEFIESPTREIIQQTIMNNETKIANSQKRKLFLSTKTALKNRQIYHTAFPTPETAKMRQWGVLTLIIFGTLYLLIRSGYNYLKTLNKFFAKGILSLANQILLLFLCLSLLIVCYTYGAFDKIYINWEYMIGAIAIVILAWIVFNFLLIILSLFVIRKWENLEFNSDTLENLKQKIREKQNECENAKETFEFFLLKRFFFVPLFPVLKSSSLREELKFSGYLEQCLLKKLRLFFKISWTSWVSLIVILMFWNVFIIPSSVKTSTIFIMLIPLLGILMSMILYFYSHHIYRNVVGEVTEETLNDYQKINFSSNDIFQTMCYPKYLLKYIHDESEINKAKKVGFSYNE